ncbi:SUKH-3 domain-containing protein [Spirillospora sp. NPDC048819]|uniref:SUKH-3 domain-containing protein n=1 Tax=Spirillospora sp. NPDC048819 TaxID=3155268 RepID=UPI0033EF721D
MVTEEEFTALVGPAGWFPFRRVDTSAAVEMWTERGFALSRAAVAFVAEFDQISLEYPRHPSVGGMHTCLLDAVQATRSIYTETLNSYSERVQEQLCPIGLAASSHLVLMIAPTGRIYGGYANFLAYYGSNGREAIWNICHRIDGLRIDESTPTI